MKKTLYYITLISILLLTTASSCTKDEPDEPQLPTAENTMYYYLDGELIIPESHGGGGTSYPAISYSLCYLEPETFNITTDDLYFHFYNGINEIGAITLNQSDYDICHVYDNHAFYSQSELWDDGIYHTTGYYTQDATGTVNISYLSDDKKHFKGTFEMTLHRENTEVTKHITNGHFNINLNTLEL